MKYIDEIDIDEKIVLLRSDLNVPIKDGKIVDNNKIIKSMKTINYLINHNCKVIILSHLGRVKTEEDKSANSLKPVYEYLKNLYDNVYFSSDAKGKELDSLVSNLNNGEILIVENTRFLDVAEKLESNNDLKLAKYWAGLAEVFCLDAFGSAHRCHASTAGVAKYMPSCLGLLVKEELTALEKIVDIKERPFTVIMGGAKVDDKIALIKSLLAKCDNLILGGGIANTFLKVLGFNVGKSLVSGDNEILSEVKTILDEYKEKIVLPIDVKVLNNDKVFISDIKDIENDDIVYDIGDKTLEKYASIINNSKLIFVNGTVGLYEDHRFAAGTKKTLELLKNSKASVIVGGGDGVSAVRNLGYEKDFYYLSTGGGATLLYISEGSLSAIEYLKEQQQ